MIIKLLLYVFRHVYTDCTSTHVQSQRRRVPPPPLNATAAMDNMHVPHPQAQVGTPLERPLKALFRRILPAGIVSY